VIVADTNLLAYFFIDGEFTAAATAVYDRDSNWVAPPLWRSEMLNVLSSYVRRGSLSLAQAVEIFRSAEEVVLSSVEEPSPEEILRLAAASRCTAYDCEYVALAQLLGVPLVTNDGPVLRAFPATAMSLEAFVA
jgi:predicted nucleic acid-binding protein